MKMATGYPSIDQTHKQGEHFFENLEKISTNEWKIPCQILPKSAIMKNTILLFHNRGRIVILQYKAEHCGKDRN